MSALKQSVRMSVEEYLAFEEQSEERHEYLDGYIRAMASESTAHNLIGQNIVLQLRNRLRGSGCQPFFTNLKVWIEARNRFYYPDALVTCQPEGMHSYFQNHPSVIFEVLSPSTELKDRREKLSAYFTLPSLREYVLVAQDEIRVEIYRLIEPGVMRLEVLGEGDELRLDSLPPYPLTLTLDEIYEDVRFSET